MSAAGVRGKGKGLRAALVPASTRKVNDGWTNNAFDAASLVVGNPRLMRVCARQVVTHVDAALTAGVDPLSDEFVRDAVTILNIGAQAACTGLTMSVLSLAPEVKLALYRFGTAVAHHHLHDMGDDLAPLDPAFEADARDNPFTQALVISYLGVLLTPSPSLPGDVSGRGVAAAMAQIAVRRVESFKQLVLAVTPAEALAPPSTDADAPEPAVWVPPCLVPTVASTVASYVAGMRAKGPSQSPGNGSSVGDHAALLGFVLDGFFQPLLKSCHRHQRTTFHARFARLLRVIFPAFLSKRQVQAQIRMALKSLTRHGGDMCDEYRHMRFRDAAAAYEELFMAIPDFRREDFGLPADTRGAARATFHRTPGRTPGGRTPITAGGAAYMTPSFLTSKNTASPGGPGVFTAMRTNTPMTARSFGAGGAFGYGDDGGSSAYASFGANDQEDTFGAPTASPPQSLFR